MKYVAPDFAPLTDSATKASGQFGFEGVMTTHAGLVGTALCHSTLRAAVGVLPCSVLTGADALTRLPRSSAWSHVDSLIHRVGRTSVLYSVRLSSNSKHSLSSETGD